MQRMGQSLLCYFWYTLVGKVSQAAPWLTAQAQQGHYTADEVNKHMVRVYPFSQT